MAKIPNPTRDMCIEVSARIVSSVISSGKLSETDAVTICKYFGEIYRGIYQVVTR